MARVVAGVMRQRAERERVLIQRLRLAQKIEYEVAAAHIVRKITEKLATQRVIAHILNDGSAIGISVGRFEIIRRGVGEAYEQQRLNIVFPGRVNYCFVR